ncbi:MAG: S41 family peptidase [Dysgonamonadaceae bacterium]|nr:S41 family peptidase [Dysgonamonadaceae bacterium]
MKHLTLIALLSVCLFACSFGQANQDAYMRKVSMAMAAIENMYVDTINKNKLAEDAIVSLLEKLDPHSNYMTPEEMKEMNESLQGNFDGIGVQFNMLTDTLYIVQVVPGGPSEKVGIMAGDRIIMVNDTLIAGVGMKNTDIMSRLRGLKGTVVNVKIKRGNEPALIPFRIVRDKIPTYSLDAFYMIDNETGYIKLNRFAATTYSEFITALQTLQSQGLKNLILDLQDNGGGYMEAATDISNEFLKWGNLIVYTEGAHQKRAESRASYKGSFETGKLVVMVNESSASASEIVSGALQDWDRAVIVGRRTFGKGLVQRPIPFADGSMMRLTVARYYTPSGRSIQKPYEKGNSQSYNMDLIMRYNKGEMISADSIHFPDSLKYSTLINHRTVYGGGGIMPDYFVPLDTNRITKLHRSLIASNSINKYTLSLIDKNRKNYKSKYENFNSFKDNFTVTAQMLNDLLELYKKEKEKNSPRQTVTKTVKSEDDKVNMEDPEELLPSDFAEINMDEFKKSEALIKLQIKALVARDLWNINEYFQIFNEDNETLKKAVQIIEDSEMYYKLLGKN